MNRRRLLRKLLGWTFLGAMLIGQNGAAAGPALRYDVPPGDMEVERCPAASDFRDALAARLGHDPFAQPEAPSVSVHVERKKAGFSGHLRLTPRGGTAVERTLVGERCDELVRAMAVTLAVMLDPLGENFVPERPAARTAEAPPPEVSPQPQIVTAPPARDVSPPLKTAPIQFDAEAGAVGSVGLFPALGLGGRLSLGVQREAWSIRLEGRFDSVLGDVEVAGGKRTTTALMAGGILGCYEASLFFGCLVTTAGSYRARATFVTTPSTRTAFWLGAGVRLGTEIRMGDLFGLVPHVEGLIPILRSDLEVDDGHVLWEAPPVTIAFGLAARTRFD